MSKRAILIKCALFLLPILFLSGCNANGIENNEPIETVLQEVTEENGNVEETESSECNEIVVESEETENTESSNRTLSVYDAKQFLEGKKTHTVNISTENEVSTEPEIIESVEVAEPVEETSTEIVQSNVNEAGYYDSNSDVTSFDRVPVSCVDFANNANLLALQAEVNPIIDADGGCNQGFVLKNGQAIVSYVGEAYFVDAEIKVTSSPAKTTLSVNCNLNDISWRCLSAVMEEIYPGKGAALVSECRTACESGSPVYSSFDTWVEFNGIHTKVVLAENGDSLVFAFR